MTTRSDLTCNRNLSYEIQGMAEKLSKLAVEAKENEDFITRLTADDAIAARLTAERRVVELEEQLAQTTESLRNMSERNRGQVKMLQNIRYALNARGINPLADHALAVFRALAVAAPDHPLLAPRGTPEKDA